MYERCPVFPNPVIPFLGVCWKHVGNPQISNQLLRTPAKIYKAPGNSQCVSRAPFDLSSDLRASTFSQSPRWWKRSSAWEIFPLMANPGPKPHIWASSAPRPVVFGQAVLFKFETGPMFSRSGGCGPVCTFSSTHRTPKRALATRGDGRWKRLACIRSEGCGGESARSAHPLIHSKPGCHRSEREVRAKSRAPPGAGERPEFPAGAPAGTAEIPLCGAHP